MEGKEGGYPVPDNEEERLEALESYDVLDSAPETAYDDLVDVAAEICDAPIALISLVDEERQWFKARRGLDDVEETSRDLSFCARAIMDPPTVMVVEDATEDPRFADNPLVTGEPGFRFYAGAPIVTDDGHALGTICVLDTVPRRLSERQRTALEALSRHVTTLLELRRAGEKLARSRRELEGFARSVSEDLRDPLTAVLGSIELATDHVDDGSRVRELLDDARVASESLLDQIELLGEYTQREGPQPAATKRVDLDEILEQTRTALSTRIEESGAEIVVDGDLPVVEVDPRQVRALLTNLIGNALRYPGDEKPRIRIGAEVVDGRCHVPVSDAGLEVPAEVTGAFFDVETLPKGPRRGTGEHGGLGLVLCHRIVERHGGEIDVDPEGEGGGTTFRFTLPAA